MTVHIALPDWLGSTVLRLRRLRYRIAKFRGFGQELQRRGAVEAELFDMAAGKKPLPTADDCRRLALKLGVPDEYRHRKG